MSTITRTAPDATDKVLMATIEAANAVIRQQPSIDLDDLTSLVRASLVRQGYSYSWDDVRAVLFSLRQEGRLVSPRQAKSVRKGTGGDDDEDWWQE